MDDHLENKKESRPLVLDLTPGEIETFIYKKRTIDLTEFPSQEYLQCSQELKVIREKIAKLEKERIELTAQIPQLDLKIVEIKEEIKKNASFEK